MDNQQENKYDVLFENIPIINKVNAIEFRKIPITKQIIK